VHQIAGDTLGCWFSWAGVQIKYLASRAADSMAEQLAGAEPAGVTCGICHNDHLQSVGELDSCFHRFVGSFTGSVLILGGHLHACAPACKHSVHGTQRDGHDTWITHDYCCSCCRFCFPCIMQWSQIESRCPFCKARFARLLHRRLSPAALKAPDAAQGYLDGKVLEVLSEQRILYPASRSSAREGWPTSTTAQLEQLHSSMFPVHGFADAATRHPAVLASSRCATTASTADKQPAEEADNMGDFREPRWVLQQWHVHMQPGAGGAGAGPGVAGAGPHGGRAVHALRQRRRRRPAAAVRRCAYELHGHLQLLISATLHMCRCCYLNGILTLSGPCLLRMSAGLVIFCCPMRRLRPGDAHVLRRAYGGARGRLALPRVRRGGGGARRKRPCSERLGAGGAGSQRRR
jgi:hypothetical protein